MKVTYEQMQSFLDEVQRNELDAVRARLTQNPAWAKAEYATKCDRPLHVVHSKAMADLLIEHGADVNARDGDGHTPLHKAAREGFSDPVKSLISAGADLNAVDDRGYTPLAWAVQDAFEGEQTTAILLDAGAEYDLVATAGLGDVERVQTLLSTNSSLLNSVNSEVLMSAIVNGIGDEAGRNQALEVIAQRGLLSPEMKTQWADFLEELGNDEMAARLQGE